MGNSGELLPVWQEQWDSKAEHIKDVCKSQRSQWL